MAVGQHGESAAQMFTYDAIGNPTNILGVEMVWSGRQLTELISPDDSYVSHVSYAYNTDGQRVSKTATFVEDQSTQTTEYFYNGSILAGQKTGDDTLVFMYDNNGDYFGFTVNGTPYYYVKNAQNDVLAVTDASGEILLYYRYDAWGQFYIDIVGSDDAAVEEACLNPITYRSYYIDLETAFYYLNTRYYITTFCRFLNADAVISGSGESVHGYNIFAYCFNNPVNMSDEYGNWPKWIEKAANAIESAIKKVVSHVKSSTSSLNNVQLSKKATNRPDSGLAGVPDEEIQRRARDKSLSGKERNRYREEEKVRGLRNKQKRQSNMTPVQIGQIVCGVAIVTVAVVGIIYIVANDVTGVGAADDILIAPLVTFLNQGTILIFQTA